MTIQKIKKLEDCFENSHMYDVLFDRRIDNEFAEYFCSKGDSQYFKDFAKPFFKIQVPGGLLIKGVVGNNTVRIILSGNEEKILNIFKQYIIDYQEVRI